jgi:RNA polymerase sigma-70 factor (ECF subfamily)
MSSSFPVARFPVLPLTRQGKETGAVEKVTTSRTEELPDEMLLTQVSTGDQEALAVLFRRYARLVWSVGERIVRNKAEADDLLQEVFLLIQRRASVFDSSKGTAKSLIVHMTYQRALSRRRYLNARHNQLPSEAEERATKIAAPVIPFYDESLEARFGRERLRQVLGEMSEDQRETLRLFFFEGYTLQEIAGRLGQSIGQVKHHYYRGLGRLRRHIPKSQPGGRKSGQF